MQGHIPVLKDEVLTIFKETSGTFLDGTFGGGGHTEALLEQSPELNIIGLDVDPEAKQRAENLQKNYPKRFKFIGINFSELDTLQENFSGILLDLGVSSFQLDDGKRGFSFRQNGPLDMRMNPEKGLSAQAFLKTASREALIGAIRDAGEEPQWRSVVNGILAHRDRESWDTTLEFVHFLENYTAVNCSKKPGIHAATRVFQGLRIAVNQELEHLRIGIKKAFEALTEQGILAIITFHSLEDRIVKQNFYEWCGRSLNRYDAQPRQLKTVKAELGSRKPLTASQEEITQNPRSRSAKLRFLRKL